MQPDFTLNTYRQLLEALQRSGYKFYTFKEWCEQRVEGKFVILRHDIDKRPENALDLAWIESELGIKASYFFKTSSDVFQPATIKNIASLGHEIGYHYRDFVDARGNKEKALQLFQNNLNKMRIIVPIRTIAMDGCPWSKLDNRVLWENTDYEKFDILGEPYFDFLLLENTIYFTDTGRCWNGEKFNVRDKKFNPRNLLKTSSTIKTTFDLIHWIETSGNNHPIMLNSRSLTNHF